MQATQPTPESTPQPSADAKADAILKSYFDSETSPTPHKEEEPAQVEQAEGQPSLEDAEQAAPEGDEGEPHYTLAELADHLEMDAAALYAAEVSMPDGTRIPVGKMKDEWQEAQKLASETQAQQQQLEHYKAQLQQHEQMLQAQQGIAQLQPDAEEQQMYADWAALDRAEKDQAYWDQLGKQDAGSAALALQRLQGQKRNLEQQLQGKQTTRQQQAQEKQQEYLKLSHQEIGQRIPEWKNDQVVKQDWSDISALWSKFGMPQAQIDALWQSPAAMHMSHSFLTVLRQLNNASPEKKKVVHIRGLKAGKRTEKPKNERLEALTKAAKTGNRKAQEAAASELLKGIL